MSSFGSGAVRVGDFMRYFERRYRPVDLGQAARIAGLPERSARRVLRTVIAEGLLASATPKGPVSLRFPAETLDILFPRLYPEA